MTARALSRLLEKMQDTAKVIPPAPLFYRHLQMDLTGALDRSGQDYETELTISPESREELRWWDEHMCRWNGRSMVKEDRDLTIESDAGWAAVCLQQRTGGPWSEQESHMHITASNYWQRLWL